MPSERRQQKLAEASRDILCGGCGHSIMNHCEGTDAPDIWPCDLCACNCYSEDVRALEGGDDAE